VLGEKFQEGHIGTASQWSAISIFLLYVWCLFVLCFSVDCNNLGPSPDGYLFLLLWRSSFFNNSYLLKLLCSEKHHECWNVMYLDFFSSGLCFKSVCYEGISSQWLSEPYIAVHVFKCNAFLLFCYKFVNH